MARLETVTLKGKSGNQYDLGAYPISDTFAPLGAVFVQPKRTVSARGENNHSLIYVGQTGDLSSRPLAPDKQKSCDRFGANCMLLFIELDPAKRQAVENDLRQAYDPPCNRD
jgi:hypothetical protein